MKRFWPLILIVVIASVVSSPLMLGAKDATTKGPVLFATVMANGTIVSGQATAVTKIGLGNYMVNFNVDISRCAAVAVAGSVASDSGALVAMPSVHPVAATPTAVQALFVMSGGASGIFVADTSFHLIVAC